MAINAPLVAEKIFNIIKGYGFAVKSYDSEGIIEIDPQKATRFAVARPNLLVRLDPDEGYIYMSTGNGDDEHVATMRKALRQLAQDYMLNFDYGVFGKNITPKAEKVDIQRKQEELNGGVMEDFEKKATLEGFGAMTGSTKTSYQPLENVKIVVRHRKPVNEESRGARSRNIQSIYIQRGEERFKMAENNLKAARAMARHINNGGEMFDSVGHAITEMASEQRQLSEFVRYVRKANLVNETNETYVQLAVENVETIKNTLHRLSGARTYTNAVESLENMANVEILEDDLDLENKFVETHFDERVSNAITGIKRSMSRHQNYQKAIETAIQTESFDGLRDVLHEDDAIEFATPHARLSYQVSRLGDSAQNNNLRSHLQGISKKLSDGGSLDAFDYRTVKSCLLQASTQQPPVATQPAAETYESQYAKFLDAYDIL